LLIIFTGYVQKSERSTLAFRAQVREVGREVRVEVIIKYELEMQMGKAALSAGFSFL